MRAVGVVERADAAAVAGEHVGHVLRLVLGEADEADARAGEHAQPVLLLQRPRGQQNITQDLDLRCPHLSYSYPIKRARARVPHYRCLITSIIIRDRFPI